MKDYIVKTYEMTKLFGFATREEAQFIADNATEPLRVVAVHILKASFCPDNDVCCWLPLPESMFATVDKSLSESMACSIQN